MTHTLSTTTMKLIRTLLCTLALSTLLVSPSAFAQSNDPLVSKMQAAIGSTKTLQDQIKQVKFTWKHKSGASRSYDWNLETGKVNVKLSKDAEPVEITTKASPSFTPAQLQSHKAFINDHYWLFFEHLFPHDKSVTTTALSQDAVAKEPNKPKGTTAILAVQYAKQGGYTPGDLYHVFLDADAKPLGWGYHPSGARKAALVTSKEDYKNLQGLMLPSTFNTPDGKMFIEIDGISVTP